MEGRGFLRWAWFCPLYWTTYLSGVFGPKVFSFLKTEKSDRQGQTDPKKSKLGYSAASGTGDIVVLSRRLTAVELSNPILFLT